MIREENWTGYDNVLVNIGLFIKALSMGEIILKEEKTYAELGDKSTFKGYCDAEEAGREH